MKFYFPLSSLILACFFALPVFPQEVDEAEFVKIFRDLNQALGFCEGQAYSLNQIENDVPEMASQARLANLEWALVFGKSCETIKDKVRLVLAERWTDHEKKMRASLIQNIGISRLSREEASSFVSLVRKRSKGDIPSPILENLLMFNPTFLANPAFEMTQGFKRTFRTQNHVKAKGVDFQIEYPMSWVAKEGIRPNIIQNIKSDNGFGNNSIMMMVKDVPLFRGRKLSTQEMSRQFDIGNLKNLVPVGSVIVEAKPIVLDGNKGAMLVYDQVGERVDVKMKARTVEFVTSYSGKMISLYCTMATTNESGGRLVDKYAKILPLCKAVANSFVLQSQYQ